jgi:hypothetical protein
MPAGAMRASSGSSAELAMGLIHRPLDGLRPGAMTELVFGVRMRALGQQRVQQLGLPCRVVVSMGVVQGARRRRQVGRLAEVEHPALGFTPLGQRNGRLARSCRADPHHRRRRSPQRVLGVIENAGLSNSSKSARVACRQRNGTAAWCAGSRAGSMTGARSIPASSTGAPRSKRDLSRACFSMTSRARHTVSPSRRANCGSRRLLLSSLARYPCSVTLPERCPRACVRHASA